MNRRTVAFSRELQSEIDLLVHAARLGIPERSGPALDFVTSWCEVHDDQSGIRTGEFGEGFIIVPVDRTPSGCSHAELELDQGLERGDITKRIRVTLIRERLHELLDGRSEDAEDYSMACLRRLRASGG